MCLLVADAIIGALEVQYINDVINVYQNEMPEAISFRLV